MDWIASKSRCDTLLAMDDRGDVFAFKTDWEVGCTVQLRYRSARFDPDADPRERELAAIAFLTKLLDDPNF